MTAITMVLICRVANFEHELNWKFPFVMMSRCHWIETDVNFGRKSCADVGLVSPNR